MSHYGSCPQLSLCYKLCFFITLVVLVFIPLPAVCYTNKTFEDLQIPGSLDFWFRRAFLYPVRAEVSFRHGFQHLQSRSHHLPRVAQFVRKCQVPCQKETSASRLAFLSTPENTSVQRKYFRCTVKFFSRTVIFQGKVSNGKI